MTTHKARSILSLARYRARNRHARELGVYEDHPAEFQALIDRYEAGELAERVEAEMTDATAYVEHREQIARQTRSTRRTFHGDQVPAREPVRKPRLEIV